MEDVVVQILFLESFEEEAVPYPEVLRGRELLQLVDVAFLEVYVEGVHIKVSSGWVFGPLAQTSPHRPAFPYCLALIVENSFG